MRRRCPNGYQVMKSLGHSTMALSEVVLPYVDSRQRPDLARADARLPQPR